MDGNFGQLDLSGLPDLNHPPAEDKVELQDRHGFNRIDKSGLAGINQLKDLLKDLLANPPREVVEELARETGNPELISQLADERATEVAHEFRRRNPGYMKSDANWRFMFATIAREEGVLNDKSWWCSSTVEEGTCSTNEPTSRSFSRACSVRRNVQERYRNSRQDLCRWQSQDRGRSTGQMGEGEGKQWEQHHA